MERFQYSQRECVLLGFHNNNNLQITRPSTNPSTPQRNSDVDFNDVFGGPPRRSSVNETLQRLSREEGDWCEWPRDREKPVFGDDNGNRRRYSNKNNDFFDDIFGGEESQSVCSTPKKRDADPFTSTVLSPALPLPSATESFASSLPPSFSLPAKLTKGVDLPTFGSPTRSREPLDINNNGISTSNGFGVQRKEMKNDSKPSYRQSLLSQEFSNSSISDKVEKESNMNKDTSISEVSPNTSNGQFHFSIYKWASKGVPLGMPPRMERTSRTKDKVKLERCSSAKEWMVNDINIQNDSAKTYNGFSLTKTRKQAESTSSSTTQNRTDSYKIVEHGVSAEAKSDILSSSQSLIKDILKDVPVSATSCDARAESSTYPIRENGKTQAASETQKLASKSLHSLFNGSYEQQDHKEVKRTEKEENIAKNTKKLSSIFDVTMNPKKQEKGTGQGSLNLGESMGKGRGGKGKVKEFVRIFNQESVTKPGADSKSPLQSSTNKQRRALRTKNYVKNDPEQSKTEESAIETTDMSANNLSQYDDISASAIPDISFAVIGDKDGSFHGNFTVQVLSQDEGEVLQNQEIQEIQVIDNKIRQWCKGKEGNIRSLLSTLQYVLWPECGWKPVPLVDIIEGNAVKRAYQRALLCLHPDKLQQKGAATDQKYIAEKVFDILQEAWTQFNMIGAL